MQHKVGRRAPTREIVEMISDDTLRLFALIFEDFPPTGCSKIVGFTEIADKMGVTPQYVCQLLEELQHNDVVNVIQDKRAVWDAMLITSSRFDALRTALDASNGRAAPKDHRRALR